MIFTFRNGLRQLSAAMCITFFLITTMVAAETSGGGDAFRVALEGSFLYGPVEGFLQTPSGGQPGTTSDKRPTLQELDIDRASVGDASLALDWFNHELYFGSRLVRLSGESVLSNALISQGKQFPTGASVKADVQLDWYRLGYRYRVSHVISEGRSLDFCPSVGFALLDFGLELDGPGSLSVDRSYAKGCPQLGLKVQYELSSKVSLSGELLGSLPFSNMPRILSGQVLAKYKLLERGSFATTVSLGAGYDQIYYEDNQAVPNDIEVDMGPMMVAGMEISF